MQKATLWTCVFAFAGLAVADGARIPKRFEFREDAPGKTTYAEFAKRHRAFAVDEKLERVSLPEDPDSGHFVLEPDEVKDLEFHGVPLDMAAYHFAEGKLFKLTLSFEGKNGESVRNVLNAKYGSGQADSARKCVRWTSQFSEMTLKRADQHTAIVIEDIELAKKVAEKKSEARSAIRQADAKKSANALSE